MIAGTRRNFMVYSIPSGRLREITTRQTQENSSRVRNRIRFAQEPPWGGRSMSGKIVCPVICNAMKFAVIARWL